MVQIQKIQSTELDISHVITVYFRKINLDVRRKKLVWLLGFEDEHGLASNVFNYVQFLHYTKSTG